MDPTELWLLLDGVGRRFAERHRFLEWLPARAPLRTVLGYSSTAIPSLLTGRTPREHGGWTLYARSPATSPFRWARPLARLPLERLPKIGWRIRRWIRSETIRRHRITGYFELYDIPPRWREQFDLTWRSNLFGDDGLGETFLSPWRRRGGSFIGAYPETDEAIVAGAERALTSGVRRTFCYLSAIDGLLHAAAAHDRSAELEAAFRRYERWIERLLAAAQARHPEVRLIVFSDHGMTPVERTIDLGEVTRGFGLGRDYMMFLDATLARYWSDRPEVLTTIAARLAEQRGGSLLDEGGAERFDLPVAPERHGQLIWLAEPGVVISPNWMGAEVPSGMHGYDPDDPWSDGILYSNDPEAVAGIGDIVALGQRLGRLAEGVLPG